MVTKKRIITALSGVFLLAAVFIPGGYCADSDDQTDYYLDPVVVYPSILNQYYENSLRHIEHRENIDMLIEDDLNNAASVDLQSHGYMSMQSDLQIRGASFEQSDVLIDGIRVNDPQTGHFNMDIPFMGEDIDKMIVVPGPAASLNGAASQGGSLHILTKRPQGSQVKAMAMFGDNGYDLEQLSVTQPVAGVDTRTTFTSASSDGYRYNTDFDMLNVSHISAFKNDYGDLLFKFGFLDKEFGANGFYSEFYPDQREHTKTAFASIDLQSQSDDFYFNPKLYMRRQRDRFMLNQNNPSFYENIHLNYIKGAKMDIVQQWDAHKLFSGVDIAQESIDSSSLYKHKRLKNTLYSVWSGEVEDFVFSVGGNGHFYEGFKNRATPDISLGYFLTDAVKVRTAFTQSYRIPTFTELYYQSPANKGNDNLSAERSTNYELGMDYNGADSLFALTLFERQGKDLIDWVRAPGDTVYNIMNITRADTRGVQADLKYYPGRNSIGLKRWQEVYLGYSFIDREQEQNGLISKYIYDYLEHKFVAGAVNLLPYDIFMDNKLVYQERSNAAGDFIFNTRFDKYINDHKVFIKIDNLFNHGYSEKANIPMPGRWIFAGVELSW